MALAPSHLAAWRVVDATQFAQATIVNCALNDFVTKQCEHTTTNEQRPRIPIPVNASVRIAIAEPGAVATGCNHAS
jgi:hypothetical protein